MMHYKSPYHDSFWVAVVARALMCKLNSRHFAHPDVHVWNMQPFACGSVQSCKREQCSPSSHLAMLTHADYLELMVLFTVLSRRPPLQFGGIPPDPSAHLALHILRSEKSLCVARQARASIRVACNHTFWLSLDRALPLFRRQHFGKTVIAT
jgi:hypothetical protein